MTMQDVIIILRLVAGALAVCAVTWLVIWAAVQTGLV